VQGYADVDIPIELDRLLLALMDSRRKLDHGVYIDQRVLSVRRRGASRSPSHLTPVRFSDGATNDPFFADQMPMLDAGRRRSRSRL